MLSTGFEIKYILRLRPYRVEHTGSLPNSAVKQRRARLVLRWGTAREDLRVLLAFFFRRVSLFNLLEAGRGDVRVSLAAACRC